MVSDIPWAIDTASVRGRKTEKVAAKRLGARLHAGSGAGPEKDDFSTDDAVIEFKNPNKTHTIQGEKLVAQFTRAARQGKAAMYTIYFEDFDITLEGTITRGLPKRD